MKRRLLDILACPLCGESFSLKVAEEQESLTFWPDFIPCQRHCAWKEGQEDRRNRQSPLRTKDCAHCYGREVVQGEVVCPNAHRFAISKGVLRALHPLLEPKGPKPEEDFLYALARHRKVKATFDLEWRVVDPAREIYGHSPQTEEQDFFCRMCVDEKFLENKIVLDVGCGIGRLADRLSQKAAEVVGVELSSGVDRAWELGRHNPRIHFIQGNLYALPLRPRIFDYVYSKGVLQYVSDPREAFDRISGYVRSGGGLSVTLYPPLPRFFSRLNRTVRTVTLRLPLDLVYFLSLMAVPLFSPAWKISGMAERRIPWRDRGHMIFNWLAADYQNFHSSEEVVSWYRAKGFSDIRLSPLPVGIFGRWDLHEQ